MGDLDETDVNINGLEEALAVGVDPAQLSTLVKSILKSVQKDVKSIDRELKGEKSKVKRSPRRTGLCTLAHVQESWFGESFTW